MRKLYLLIFIILFSFCFTEQRANCEESNSGSEKSWNEMLEFDRNWSNNQEAVTDEEFEKVMKRFEKKKKPKKYEFEADETRDSLNDMSILNEIANHTPVILFPTNLRSYEGETIPAGYYKLNYVEKDKKHYLYVTQGRNLFAKLEMKQTNENFDAESIQFAEIRPNNDNETMKLIYGNLDLNLIKNLYIVY